MTKILTKLHKHYNDEEKAKALDSLNEMFNTKKLLCKNCSAEIHTQLGFNMFLDEWKCTNCDYVNNVDKLLNGINEEKAFSKLVNILK